MPLQQQKLLSCQGNKPSSTNVLFSHPFTYCTLPVSQENGTLQSPVQIHLDDMSPQAMLNDSDSPAISGTQNSPA